MPLSRPGLPPVYHEGEKRPPMAINARRPTGDLPTEVKGQVLPPGTTLAPTGSVATQDVMGKQLFPSSEAPAPQVKQPTAEPTPQSPPDHQDSTGDKAWRQAQRRAERKRLAAAEAEGQNAGGDTLLS